MIGAKAQPSNTLMPILASKKNFQLRPACWVRRIVYRNGRAEGVIYAGPNGEEIMQPAKLVVLASWTLNNTRLLLLSGIGQPYDPATGKGTLGRNLTHQVCAGLQLFFDKPLNGFMGAGGLGMAIGDFEGEEKLGPGVLRGGGIILVLAVRQFVIRFPPCKPPPSVEGNRPRPSARFRGNG